MSCIADPGSKVLIVLLFRSQAAVLVCVCVCVCMCVCVCASPFIDISVQCSLHVSARMLCGVVHACVTM